MLGRNVVWRRGLLLLVAAAWSAPGVAPAAGLLVRRGQATEPLTIALDIAHVPVNAGVPSRPARPLRWTRSGATLVGTASGPDWDATVALGPQDAGSALDVTLRLSQDVSVVRERVRVTVTGPARVIHRDLRWAPLTAPLRVDRGTPIVIATPSMAIVGGQGFVAARYLPSTDGAATTTVDLVVDDGAAHPFSTYAQCWKHLDPTTPWREYEHRVPHTGMSQSAGTVIEAHAMLYPLDPRHPAVPAIVERWPSGARAAIVLTDHADRTDPQALRAVLYGSSDAKDPAYGTRGVFGHGLRLTRTFFARDRLGGLATDPAAQALADELVAHGSEVGSHTITPEVDERDRVRTGLDTFARWHTTTWIDHQPYTNCEDVSSQGAERGGPFAIVDLLAGHGYRWVWAATDVPRGANLAEDDLFAGDPLTAHPALFPLPADPRLFVFGSSWLYERPKDLAALVTDAALDALEARRGLVVAHTYLAPSAQTTKLADHQRRLVVHRTPSGALVLDPEIETVFARLGARVGTGRLLVPPWREVGERLRALGAITTSYRADGSLLVANEGSTDIVDLTLAVPASGLAFVVDGTSTTGHRAEPDRSTIWFSLPAGRRATLQATRDGAPVPFFPITAARAELR